MSYQFNATKTFWENFYALSPSQKESTRRAWEIFKTDPFDARLRPYKIHSLSARYKRIIHSVTIEGDLRVVFLVEGNIITSLDIGKHAIYR